MDTKSSNRSTAEWHAVFARYNTSGLSITRFCQQEHIGTSTFYRWRGILAASAVPEAGAQSQTTASPFVDLGALAPCTQTVPERLDLRLELGSGMVLHLVRG